MNYVLDLIPENGHVWFMHERKQFRIAIQNEDTSGVDVGGKNMRFRVYKEDSIGVTVGLEVATVTGIDNVASWMVAETDYEDLSPGLWQYDLWSETDYLMLASGKVRLLDSHAL